MARQALLRHQRGAHRASQQGSRRDRQGPRQDERRPSRRLSPRLYKFLLTAHIIVSVGWLGIVAAKLVIGIGSVSSAATAAATVRAMTALDIAFPLVAIPTAVTGVALSLGTRWGLLRHYWVATKVVLTVAVIATAVGIGDALVQQAVDSPAGGSAGWSASGVLDFVSAPVNLLIALSVSHALMLIVATALVVYKPWGKTWFARRDRPRPVAAPATAGTDSPV